MAENPYESPTTEPTKPPPHRLALGVVLFSLLAIPAAAVAGGTTCTAAVAASPLSFLIPGFAIGLVGGFAASLGILLLADGLWEIAGRGRQPNWNFTAAMGHLLLATPVAIVVGIVVAVFLGSFWRHLPTIWPGPTQLLAGGVTAFAIWSTGFWLGLRNKPRRHGATEQPRRSGTGN